uniref:hypothetical protein n=1 Tax=Marinobacterium profundum TaxID=1714300 RepID=UPI001315758E|nr:hypothetical protein [Marinobacterium profundum]
MEPLSLRVKFKDALKIAIKNTWLPFLLGIGLAAYRGSINSDSIALVSLLLTGILAIVALLLCSIPCLELTRAGINFKNWRGRDEFCGWSNDLTLVRTKQGGYLAYLLKNSHQNKTYKVPSVLFTYPEVHNFINTYAPRSHVFRGHLSDSSGPYLQ